MNKNHHCCFGAWPGRNPEHDKAIQLNTNRKFSRTYPGIRVGLVPPRANPDWETREMYSLQKVDAGADATTRSRLAFNLESSQELPEQFKCPVCLDVPEAELYQCVNGHTICKKCYREDQCSVCRGQMVAHLGGPKIRCRAVENLLDSILLACPFRRNGCSETVSGRANLKLHKENCFSGNREHLGFQRNRGIMFQFQKVANSATAALRSTLALDLDSTNIPEHFRCYICLKVPGQEIFQCANGHIVCSGCCKEHCSFCNVHMQVNHAESPIRCRALEEFLDSLLIACPFKAKGCLETAVGRGNIKAHADECAFKGMNCVRLCSKLGFQGTCNYHVAKTTKYLELLEHMRTEHQVRSIEIFYGRVYRKLMMIPAFVLNSGDMAPVSFAPCPPLHLETHNAHILAGLMINPVSRTMSTFGLRIDKEKERGNLIEVGFEIKKTTKMPALKWKMSLTSILNLTRNPQESQDKQSLELLKTYCLNREGRIDIDIKLIQRYEV